MIVVLELGLDEYFKIIFKLVIYLMEENFFKYLLSVEILYEILSIFNNKVVELGDFSNN